MYKQNLSIFSDTNASVFVKQALSICSYKSSKSWVILNPIEQKIKTKIEAAGTSLKEWDVRIYRGILTGYNEAFIIDGKKRAELIEQDSKSEEIIRRYTLLMPIFPSVVSVGESSPASRYLHAWSFCQRKLTIVVCR